MSSARALAAFTSVLLCACAGARPSPAAKEKPALPAWEPSVEPADPAARPPAPPVLVRNATVRTAAGKTFAPGHVLVVDGRIASVGPGEVPVPPGGRVIDAAGRVVTPGLIDSHSHIGVYPMPSTDGNLDGNEITSPVTAEVWAEHGFWPQDPAIERALAGGVTTIQVLPGSTNLVGGRSFVAHLRPAASARAMRFPGAPQGLKMACGENPKKAYGGEKKSAPMTRMGNVAGARAAFEKARAYRRTWQKYDRDLALWRERREEKAKNGPGVAAPAGDGKPGDKPDDPPDPPTRDLGLETLVQVLEGKILVQNHCYRADEMALMLDLAREQGFRIRSFHHALEAYKLRRRLAEEEVAVSTWSDWWGFKMEAFDGVPQNAAMLAEVGVRAIIHSDSDLEIRHLNQEAAKAMTAGRKVGIPIDEEQALRWVTANPAWALGIDGQVGTLERGKRGDLVIWSASPFSVYALADVVLVDGEPVWERGAARPRMSDFELAPVEASR